MAATRIAAGGFQHARQAQQAAGNAPVTGLTAVRDELEHRPRDPFKGNETAILAEIGPDWPEYQPAYEDGWWTSKRKDGTGKTLRELSPDELIAAMRAAS